MTAEQMLSVAGQTIGFHSLSGAGPLVVAVHGAEGSWREWEPLVERLGDRYRFVALDLPWRAGNDYGWGSGGSAGDWLHRAMARFDEPVFAMLGHSLGANALLEYLCMPDRVDLAATMLLAPFYRPREDRVDDALRQEFSTSFRYAVADGIRTAMGARYARLDRSLFESIVDTALGRIGESGIATLFQQFVKTGTLPLSGVLPPSRVLSGEPDPALNERRGGLLGRAMPAATVTRHAEYRHCFHLTHADELAADVQAFLAQAARGPGDSTDLPWRHAHA
ncbi:alpha/beta hydrolase [Streptomyces sp. NBC_01275]|uniref:alpha/beta fold hydrolase n=1 Tax=Streptomyces sp. NBC_01275 TaxID=2903807 RepID=UPI00224F9AAB|nr:alpha/beta hydrolase [Streptomyces sp. NBC_01275]MCX4763935.1 alpha/beta hydrolase [Streptomyces sp. NBC_01275]